MKRNKFENAIDVIEGDKDLTIIHYSADTKIRRYITTFTHEELTIITYIGITKNRRCSITLTKNEKHKRNDVLLKFESLYDGEWCPDVYKQKKPVLRWKEAESIAERWLLSTN